MDKPRSSESRSDLARDNPVYHVLLDTRGHAAIIPIPDGCPADDIEGNLPMKKTFVLSSPLAFPFP